MNFEEVVKKRHSVRDFKTENIKKGLLMKALKIANLSPSAGNLQARKVFIVEKKGLQERISKAALNQSFIQKAPLVLVICADLKASASKYGERGKKLYSIQDATIFTSYLQLALTNEGLSSCWVGAFSEPEVRKVLSLPIRFKPIAILPVGLAAREPGETPRKNIEKIVERIK